MGCEVIAGGATLTGKHTVEVDGRTLTAPRIVLATGSKPFVPPIDGLDDVPYLTNENLFDLTEQPDHLVIIGGGVIGMEMAQSFRRLGSEVTVINPGPLMGRDDQDIGRGRRRSDAGRRRPVRRRQSAKRVSKARRQHYGPHRWRRGITGSHLLVAVGRTARHRGFGAGGARPRNGQERHRGGRTPPHLAEAYLRHRRLPRRAAPDACIGL